MDTLIWIWISFCLAIVLWFILSSFSKSLRPPGPPGWPLIGNIFDVGMMPHQNLQKLRSKYGPVLWLKLGLTKTLVVQSAKAAEELFKKHDLTFSDRIVIDSMTACDWDKGSIIFGLNGEYLRKVRKITTSELFVHKKISASAPTRQTCIDIMLQWIEDDSEESRKKGGSGEIQFEKHIKHMSFNLLSNYLLSKDIMDSKSENANEFVETLTNFMERSGEPNLVDLFPFLKWLDPQGTRRTTGKYSARLINITSGFVKERIQEKLSAKDQRECKDVLDALLEHKGKGGIDELPEWNVAIIVLEMFLAGLDSSSSTITWGIAELLRNPDSLRKLKDEIDQVIGNSRKVEEGDLNSLPYLQAVIKETLRLHPAAPLLVPRNSREETTFMGYHIPKNTMVLVNVWAIHRDPDSWDDPLSFKPERFMNSNIDWKGLNFEFLPFGSGRRSCIGMLFGDRIVSLTLAKIIQTFDLKLPEKVSPENMDMREKMGIGLHKMVPLIAIPVKRKL